MLKQGRNHSPDAKTSGHEPKLRQRKHGGTTFWWNEKKAEGGKVDRDGANERHGKVGTMPPTIGPRVA
jgi:hypothetical protein